MRGVLVVCFLFLNIGIGFASDWVPIKHRNIEYPLHISGVYSKGHNVTEPRVQEGKYFKVESAGIIVLKRGGAFFLNVRIADRPKTKYYITIKYPNPEFPENPFVNDVPFSPIHDYLKLSSPDVINGLSGYGDYDVIISVYKDEESMELIDTVTQTIRSYADTRGKEILIFKKVLSTI